MAANEDKNNQGKNDQDKKELYALTPAVKEQGYSAVIDGRQLTVIPQVHGMVYNRKAEKVPGIVVPAKCVVGEFDPEAYDPTKFPNGFEDLKPQEIHELAAAHVIELNDEQGKKYNKWLDNYYKGKVSTSR